MYKIFFKITILLFLLQGCRKTSEVAMIEKPSFDFNSFVKSDSIKIPDLLKIQPLWWAVKNDKIVMVSPQNNDYYLYVFSLPQFNLLYKYGTRGQGPNEFVLVSWINMLNENQIGLYDSPKKNMYIYDLYADTLQLNKTFNYSDLERESPFSLIQQIEGTEFIFKAYNRQNTVIDFVDINTGEISQTFTPFLKRKNKRSHYTAYLLKASANKNMIAFAYLFIDRIELFHINKDKLAEPFLIIGDKKNQEDKRMDDYDVYYTDVHCDNKYIYALSQQGEKNENIKNSAIEIYDLNGVPIKKITLDRHIRYFTIDDKNSVIYGNDSYSDFDYVYVYKIDI